MLICVKTYDSRIRYFVGSTNREQRGIAVADTTYVDPSAVGVHKNTYDIWSICNYSLTRGLCYAMHVRISCLLILNMHGKVFSTFLV